MYARSTTIHAQLASLDRGIAFVRDELMPAITGIEGCVGLSMLVDRDTGRCIATSAWHSEDAMRRSEDEVRPLRERYAATFGATDLTVHEWEIAVLHRTQHAPDGGCARATWLRADPSTLDQSIESFKMVMPILEDFPGFCSASLLVNRESGFAVSTVLYDSSETLVQTRDQANGLRTRVAADAGAEVVEVAEFELALAHLRAPELV